VSAVIEENNMSNKHKPDTNNYSVYQELSIEFDPAEADWADGAHQTASEIEKRVVLKNGSQPVSGCQVVLEELAYHFRDEWTDPPNGYERKALRWVDGSDAQDGKIVIPANGSATLAILRMYRYPNPYFGITYADGSSGKTHHFAGAYRLRLRLDGEIGDKASRQVIEPPIYEVYLRYVGALELKIEDIMRVTPGEF
jgi:hypothetical protein